MIAPDEQFFDSRNWLADLGRDLRQGAVVVQAQHCREVLGWQVRCRFHGDVSVGVGWIAHHQYLDIARSDGVQRLALHGENLCIGFQQVFTFHAWAAWAGANQQGNVSILECCHRIAVCGDAGQQRECAIVDFHDHALQRFLCFFVRDFKQLQNDRLIFAEQVAVGDAEQKGIADLTSGAGNGNTQRGLSHVESPEK